jgi:hypothetical protein
MSADQVVSFDAAVGIDHKEHQKDKRNEKQFVA